METFEDWLNQNEPEIYNEFLSSLIKKKSKGRQLTDEEKAKMAQIQGKPAQQQRTSGQRYQRGTQRQRAIPSSRRDAGEVNWIG